MQENDERKKNETPGDESGNSKGANSLSKPKGSSVRGAGHKAGDGKDDSSEPEADDSKTAAKPKGSSVRGSGH